MNCRLSRTAPPTNRFTNLEHHQRTVRDGVRHHQAFLCPRPMKTGDRVTVYHCGRDKHVAGLAEVTRSAYPDPQGGDAKRVVVDLKAERPLRTPVALAAIKCGAAFRDFDLVRLPRRSVMPVPVPLWKRLLTLGGL